MNLYQKYKSLSFKDVVSHEKIIKELLKRSKANDYPQTVHFTGLTGIGKTVISHIFIKSILCQHKTDGEPCNQCDSCLSINEDRSLMSFFSYNASNIGIEEMRSIEEIALKKNAFSPHKVIYIDELQELNKSKAAQKNLLKILEKPLKNVFFILSSMDESKIDKAVLNRCVTYKLKPLSFQEIAVRLKHICEQEGIKIDTDSKANTILTLSQYSQGSLRNAISLLERVIYSDIWTEKELIDELGLVDDATAQEMLNDILIGNFKVFSVKITEDILSMLKYKLLLCSKVDSGVELNSFEKAQIKNIVNIHNSLSTLLVLNELNKFPYLDQVIIESNLISILQANKPKRKLRE